MRLVQLHTKNNNKAVANVLGAKLQLVSNFETVYELAIQAIDTNKTLAQIVNENLSDELVDYQEVIESGRLLTPLCHPDPAHFWITGTGLTHAGSAQTRDAMHKALEKDTLSDSMKIFKMGLENGKPKDGGIGVQPEWFYKGNGNCVVAPGAPLDLPEYAMDGGEEPEIACLYLIGRDGTPYRIGYALGNEYSDHIMERINYLYLSHSKLRQCAIGPELLLGELPDSVTGRVSVIRDQKTIWTKEFQSGEAHMIHSLNNLEYHHFKYELFRSPGDLHCHFFGTATFSFSDGIKIADGDQLQVESDAFGKPLVNRVKKGPHSTVKIKTL